MNFHNEPTKAIVSIQVRKRTHVPTHGWFQEPKIVPIIPTKLELIYAIYDAQREIISGMFPKRYKCRMVTTVKNIERLYHTSPHSMSFDGMTYNQAADYFQHAALNLGIRNEFSIPFIFAKEIKMRSTAFAEGYSHIFVQENGLRYQILCTPHEFHYLTTNRQLLNNLSYHLDQKYKCNLHIAYDEATRILDTTGKQVEHNRFRFTEACDYYIYPNLLDVVTFIRCQVPKLREASDELINGYLQNCDELLDTDIDLAYEFDKAKAIYTGKIKQWVGDFSNTEIIG